jgi:hypothetical protein
VFAGERFEKHRWPVTVSYMCSKRAGISLVRGPLAPLSGQRRDVEEITIPAAIRGAKDHRQ